MGFLDIDNTSKSYGAVEVLHKVDISIEEGEFLVLVGPSGCGKSTLLNMIAGLEEISSGEIRIKDAVMNGVHPSKRNIAMVFQSYALYPNMTVGQNITFGLEMHHVPKPERDKAMKDVACLLQIEPLLDRKPGALSGGQRQRVAMGRALVRNPDVFLFDEPLSNLDAKLRVDMRTEIKKLHQKLGTTIVYVTHDQIEAMTLSTRIAVMYGGYVQQLGTPQEIYNSPANIFVATFMGSPAMNVMPAKVALEDEKPVAVVALHDGASATLPFSQDNLAAWDGREIMLGIRPETITDEDAADRKSSNIAPMTNRITVTEPAGSDTFVTMTMAGKDVIARMRSDADVRPGADFKFLVNMEKAVAFDPETENAYRALMNTDVIIIGSGMGGATLAAALAPTGRRILILERGEHLRPSAKDRDVDAIFRDGAFRPDEVWLDGSNQPFNPGNYYNVGGNSKFYGAALIRYREVDFQPAAHVGGATPGWPIDYPRLEADYQAAEDLYQVRGNAADDPTEPYHSGSYPHPPVPDEPDMVDLRKRLTRVGLTPSSIPLGVDLSAWLSGGQTTWDAFPNTGRGKMDAETGGLTEALRHKNVTLRAGCAVETIEVDDIGHVTGVRLAQGETITSPLVVVAAGAVQTAALLLRSANENYPAGLANKSDQVGRNFMNHNCSAVLALHPLRKNRSVYQKTLMVNDFYLATDDHPALGNVQMLGKITGSIMAANSRLPRWLANFVSARSFDFYAMSEDLPNPESRVTLCDGQIKLDWRRSNWAAHTQLVKTLKSKLRQAGFPVVISKPFDRRTPSHQCGTARMGDDPAASVVDSHCRSHDHPNLFIVDASVLPTSAAVNPALTIAALALRAGRHIAETELAN